MYVNVFPQIVLIHIFFYVLADFRSCFLLHSRHFLLDKLLVILNCPFQAITTLLFLDIDKESFLILPTHVALRQQLDNAVLFDLAVRKYISLVRTCRQILNRDTSKLFLARPNIHTYDFDLGTLVNEQER